MELRIKQGRYLSADGINLVAGKSNDTTVGLEITEERKQELLVDFPELFEEIDEDTEAAEKAAAELEAAEKAAAPAEKKPAKK